jgi:uncharacterized membrane protein YeaQ/YmgE (transglycosylase-associated protein family)
VHFILFVLIGLIAGALAGRVVSGHGYGLLGDLIVGVVGAFLGGWLFAVAFGVVGGGLFVSLLTAFVGAVILLWVIRLLRRAAPRLRTREPADSAYDERGWRATFYTTGMEHSPTSATRTGWERTPWRSGPGRGAGRAEKQERPLGRIRSRA